MDAGGYLVVLLAAATPWVEVLFVVPAAIAIGLDPWWVGLVAFVGNAVPVVGIVLGSDRALRWWKRRRNSRQQETRRARRARHLVETYGIPGLALLGPLVIGLHLAALIAMSLRPEPSRVLAWMCGSLAVWTAVLAVLAATGTDLLRD